MEIVMLVPRIDGEWTQNTIRGFLDTCKRLDITGRVVNSQLDSNLMLLNLNQILSQEVDGVVLLSPEARSGWGIMSRALNSNIPIISIDETITDSQGRQLVPYVGIDHAEAGALAARWAAEALLERRWIQNQDISLGIAILTYRSLEGMQQRTESFRKELTRKLPSLSDNSVFPIDCASGSAVDGLLAMQQLLASHPGITNWLVSGSTADSVIGAVRALEQLEIQDNALACGIDGGSGFSEFSKDRETSYQALVYVDTYRQGSQAAEALYNFIRHRTPLRVVQHTDLSLIRRETWRQKAGQP